MYLINKLSKKASKVLIKVILGLGFLLLPIAANGTQSTPIPLKQAEYGELVAFPEATEYVKEVGEKLVKVSDFPNMPHEFIVLNASVPNAWAYRGGKIAITRGLLMKLNSESELAAILAHEIGHQVAYIKQYQRESLPFIEENSLPGRVSEIFDTAREMFYRKVMRQEEFDADYDGIRFMSKAGYEINAVIKVQNIIEGMSAGSEENANWLDLLLKTHPSPKERKTADMKTMSHYSQKGIVGEEQYSRVFKKLKDAEYAYSYLDQARDALGNRQPEQALKLARQALPTLTNEPFVHGLIADALMAIRNEKEALASLEKAIEYDAFNFSFHLNKGLILDHMGNQKEARKEIETSLYLMPTAQAHFKLAMMDLRERNSKSALLHLYAASKFDTQFGEMAKAELIKLSI